MIRYLINASNQIAFEAGKMPVVRRYIMARSRKSRKVPRSISFDPEVLAESEKLAELRGEDLSKLIHRLLERELITTANYDPQIEAAVRKVFEAALLTVKQRAPGS